MHSNLFETAACINEIFWGIRAWRVFLHRTNTSRWIKRIPFDLFNRYLFILSLSSSNGFLLLLTMATHLSWTPAPVQICCKIIFFRSSSLFPTFALQESHNQRKSALSVATGKKGMASGIVQPAADKKRSHLALKPYRIWLIHAFCVGWLQNVLISSKFSLTVFIIKIGAPSHPHTPLFWHVWTLT